MSKLLRYGLLIFYIVDLSIKKKKKKKTKLSRLTEGLNDIKTPARRIEYSRSVSQFYALKN